MGSIEVGWDCCTLLEYYFRSITIIGVLLSIYFPTIYSLVIGYSALEFRCVLYYTKLFENEITKRYKNRDLLYFKFLI